MTKKESEVKLFLDSYVKRKRNLLSAERKKAKLLANETTQSMLNMSKSIKYRNLFSLLFSNRRKNMSHIESSKIMS